MWRVLFPLFVCALLAACVPQVSLQGPEQATATGDGLNVEPVEMVAVPLEGTATGMTLAAVPHRIVDNGVLEIGPAGARHTLLVFLTPTSPYSVTYAETLLPRVVREFVTQGTLRVHVALVPFEKYPRTAAATATLLCAAKNVKGAEALSAIMRSPDAYAKTAPTGVTLSDLRTCEASPDMQALVPLHASFARSLDVTNVPTAFIDGEKQVGLPEWVDLRATLESITGVR